MSSGADPCAVSVGPATSGLKRSPRAGASTSGLRTPTPQPGVRELGGAVIVEPFDFTFGRMVEVADPHGARFLLTTF